MPSMRPATLNPRVPALPVAGPTASRAVAPVPGKLPAAPAPAGKRSAKGASPASPDGANRDDDVRAGGFHESSYELQSGLQITESEWPDDVTVPGELGSR